MSEFELFWCIIYILAGIAGIQYGRITRKK